MYQLVDDTLYRRSNNCVKLKCICREEGKELLAEIHKGMCGSHIGSRAMVGKAFRQGFYWPTTLQDAVELVNVKPASSIPRISICLPKLFRQSFYHGRFQFGARHFRPLPPCYRGFEFLFITIDKFTKWPEVEPVRKVTAYSAIKFLKRLVCRFRVPARIITDNGTQFTSRALVQYIHALGSKISFASIAHPRSTVKLRGQTLKCCEVSRQEHLIGCRSVAGDGSTSCRWFFGPSVQHQIKLPARLPSPWSMGQKQLSPGNSHMD